MGDPNSSNSANSLKKEFMLTPCLALDGGAEYDTHEKWEGQSGLHYLAAKNLTLLAQWHSDYGWGAGAEIRF